MKEVNVAPYAINLFGKTFLRSIYFDKSRKLWIAITLTQKACEVWLDIQGPLS